MRKYFALWSLKNFKRKNKSLISLIYFCFDKQSKTKLENLDVTNGKDLDLWINCTICYYDISVWEEVSTFTSQKWGKSNEISTHFRIWAVSFSTLYHSHFFRSHEKCINNDVRNNFCDIMSWIDLFGGKNIYTRHQLYSM